MSVSYGTCECLACEECLGEERHASERSAADDLAESVRAILHWQHNLRCKTYYSGAEDDCSCAVSVVRSALARWDKAKASLP